MLQLTSGKSRKDMREEEKNVALLSSSKSSFISKKTFIH